MYLVHLATSLVSELVGKRTFRHAICAVLAFVFHESRGRDFAGFLTSQRIRQRGQKMILDVLQARNRFRSVFDLRDVDHE